MVEAERVGQRRRLGAASLVAQLAIGFALVPAWYAARDRRARAELARRFFARLLGAVGVTVVVRGSPSATPATLFLANHLSFTDVVAIALEIDADFVAKADVRRWPVMGRLAARFGTVFVERDRVLGAKDQAGAIARRLSEGRSVVLFPEGTTSDGIRVLPFRSALLAAGEAAAIVQPIALRYTDGARRAYVGDESLLANLIRLAPYRAVLTIEFLAPLDPGERIDRKTLAVAAHRAISAALDGPTGACGSGGRPGSRPS